MGDGLLAEFASVVDAVECAVDIQREMAERNVGLPEDHRIDVRIGVNLGEVIVEGTDRHGEGVNIAARLEQLADPAEFAFPARWRTRSRRSSLSVSSRWGSRGSRTSASRSPGSYWVRLDGAPALRKRRCSKTRAGGLGEAGRRDDGAPRRPRCRRLVRSRPDRPATPPMAGAHVPSIAVLPFDDLSPDKSAQLPRLRGQRRHHQHVVALPGPLRDAALSFVYKGQAH